MNKKDVYKRALNTWGKQSQIIILFEEVAELQKELSKHLRGEDNRDHIAEEIADVEIMLEQMKMLFHIEDRVGQHKGEKINRLNDRVNEYVFRRSTQRAFGESAKEVDYALESVKNAFGSDNTFPYKEVEKGIFKPKLKKTPKGMNEYIELNNKKPTRDLTVNIEIEPVSNKVSEDIKKATQGATMESISEALTSVMAKANKNFYK